MQLLESTAHVAHEAMCVLPTELVCTHNVYLEASPGKVHSCTVTAHTTLLAPLLCLHVV